MDLKTFPKIFFNHSPSHSPIVYQEEDYIELCNEKISDENLQLKLEDPTEYYLKNIEDPEISFEYFVRKHSV